MFSTVLHASGVILFGYSLYYNLKFVYVPPHLKADPKFAAMDAYPGRWKYLTVWDIVLQLVYHTIALLNDIGGSNTVEKRRQSSLQRIRDAIFSSWAFPIGLFVSITFWGLYAIDRKLVFPKEMDEVYPYWLNHAVHTGPIVFMVVSLFTVPKRKPCRNFSLAMTIAFTATYLAWITWVNHVSNVWAYPILRILNTAQRAAFFGGCFILIAGLCYAGVQMTQIIWGETNVTKFEDRKPSPKKKSKRV